MWLWIALGIGLVFVIFMLCWIGNRARAIRSGELQQKPDEMQGNSPEEILNEIMASAEAQARTPPDPTPCRPGIPYRYQGWLAIRADTDQEVLDALDIDQPATCNWETAGKIISSMANTRIFVAPATDGWVLVFGALPEWEEDEPYGELWDFIRELSKRFGEAQYFYYSSTVNANTWAKAVDGEMIRAYGAADGFIAWNDGSITPEERDADLVYGESGFKGAVAFDKETGQHPDYCDFEEATSEISGRWSIDPEALHLRDDLEPSAGTLAVLRSTTLRKAPEA